VTPKVRLHIAYYCVNKRDVSQPHENTRDLLRDYGNHLTYSRPISFKRPDLEECLRKYR